MSSTQSALLYGAEVWAVMVIAGVIPFALLARERQAIYKRKEDEPREVVAREERQHTRRVAALLAK